MCSGSCKLNRVCWWLSSERFYWILSNWFGSYWFDSFREPIFPLHNVGHTGWKRGFTFQILNEVSWTISGLRSWKCDANCQQKKINKCENIVSQSYVLQHFWLIFIKVLVALDIFTFHCERKYFSADVCIFSTCCSGISKLSVCDNKHYNLLIFFWMAECVLDCVKRDVRLV